MWVFAGIRIMTTIILMFKCALCIFVGRWWTIVALNRFEYESEWRLSRVKKKLCSSFSCLMSAYDVLQCFRIRVDERTKRKTWKRKLFSSRFIWMVSTWLDWIQLNCVELYSLHCKRMISRGAMQWVIACWMYDSMFFFCFVVRCECLQSCENHPCSMELSRSVPVHRQLLLHNRQQFQFDWI